MSPRYAATLVHRQKQAICGPRRCKCIWRTFPHPEIWLSLGASDKRAERLTGCSHDPCSRVGHPKTKGPQESLLAHGTPARQTFQRAFDQHNRKARDHFRRKSFTRFRIHTACGSGTNHMPQSQRPAYVGDHGRARLDPWLPTAGSGHQLQFSL